MTLNDKLKNYVERFVEDSADRILITDTIDELERLQRLEIQLAELNLILRRCTEISGRT